MESNQNEFSANVGPQIIDRKKAGDSNYKFMAGTYIIGISGVTAAVAGYITTKIAKKKGQEYLKEFGKEAKIVMESPYSLALRALAWGTVWAVGICSLSVFGLCKWFDIKNLEDLRAKVRRKKPSESAERTEFESLSDFLNYINETSKSKPNVAKDS